MNYYINFHLIAMTILCGMARLLPVFLLLPYLNSQMLGGMLVKNIIIIFIVIGFLPHLLNQYPDIIDVPIIIILVKEVLIGLLCGFCLSVPFWVALAFGEIIDNQRGATISSTLNPGVGVESSIMAIFMNFYFAAIFVINNGMVIIVRSLYESYIVFPLNTMPDFNFDLILKVISLLNFILTKSIILVGPVVVSLFLIEISIGVLSRFAPQLNAFSVALSVKSFFAFLVLLIYLTPILTAQLLSIDITNTIRNIMD